LKEILKESQISALVEVSSLTSYAIAWLNALSSISKIHLTISLSSHLSIPTIATISLFLQVIPCLVS